MTDIKADLKPISLGDCKAGIDGLTELFNARRLPVGVFAGVGLILLERLALEDSESVAPLATEFMENFPGFAERYYCSRPAQGDEDFELFETLAVISRLSGVPT